MRQESHRDIVMKKLIVITTDVGSPFFLNELQITKKYYDVVSIIEFSGNKDVGELIRREYGFKYINIKTKIFSIDIIRNFFGWLRQDYVKQEIARYAGMSVMGIRRLVYILFYGFYFVQSKRVIEEEIDMFNGQIDLYSYWLSRSAFLVAQYKEKYCDKICRVFARAHGYDLYIERNSLNYLPFRNYIDNYTDVIYFISEDGKRYYEDKYPEFGVRLLAERKVSRLGVYTGAFKKRRKGDKETIVFASCSRVTYVKRLDLIVTVMSKLSNLYDIQWVHFGDGKLRKKIMTQCSKQLKKDKYRLYGQVDNTELLTLYEDEDIDFFINLSDSEGIPVSVMEAMSCGIPVIARNVGGVGEIVTKENGLLINSGNADEIANSIIVFLNKIKMNKDLYQKLSVNAYNTWKDRYNADNNYKNFYTEVTE